MNRPRVQIWKARDGWRWRLLAGNGRLIAESGEGYTRRRDAVRAVRTVLRIVGCYLASLQRGLR
jgi:uncharacterized protein YegP (UPF0339 family)